jgi:hypothetical protein
LVGEWPVARRADSRAARWRRRISLRLKGVLQMQPSPSRVMSPHRSQIRMLMRHHREPTESAAGRQRELRGKGRTSRRRSSVAPDVHGLGRRGPGRNDVKSLIGHRRCRREHFLRTARPFPTGIPRVSGDIWQPGRKRAKLSLSAHESRLCRRSCAAVDVDRVGRGDQVTRGQVGLAPPRTVELVWSSPRSLAAVHRSIVIALVVGTPR